MPARIIKERPEPIIAEFLAELIARDIRRNTWLKEQQKRQIEILAAKLERRIIPQNQPQPN